MNDINQYIGIIGNNKANDLMYIYKVMNLFDKFSSEEIFRWYSTLKNRNKDIKVNDKPSVSINYVLLSNPDVLNILDDKFLTLLLIDCVDQIDISEELELRIVDIINYSHTKLHRYVHKFVDRLNFNINTSNILDVNNNCAYYMAQEITTRPDSLEIFRCLILKLKDCKYKQEVENYIVSQGIINETILIHAILTDTNSYRYINNIDISRISKLICYKHLSEFIDKSLITQQYLISIKYQNCILKYSRLVKIDNELINNFNVPFFMTKDEILFVLLRNRTKFNQYETQLLMNRGSIILLEYLIGINAYLSGMLTREILQLEDKIHLRKVYEKYGFEMVRKQIEPHKHDNLEVYIQYRKLLEYIDGSEINHEIDKNMYRMIYKTKSYLYLDDVDQMKLVEYFITICSLEDLMPLIIDLKQTSNKINEFIVSNMDQITNPEYKKLVYDNNTMPIIAKSQLGTTANSDDIIQTLEMLSTKKIDEIKTDIYKLESFLKTLFSDYCFDFYGEYLPRIIKNFQNEDKICRIIFKIQENVKNILEIGFFNPTYFIFIKNILNTIIKYRVQDNCSYCTKVRKGNDKIIILLSYYTKFFDKNFQIGNVNKKI